MKYIITALFVLTVSVFFLGSCDKDKGAPPFLSFKAGGTYISHSDTVDAGSTSKIGITGSRATEEDAMKKLNISKTVNGGPVVQLFSKDLGPEEENKFDFDYDATIDATKGMNTKFIFTVTNEDGISNTIALTLTSKRF